MMQSRHLINIVHKRQNELGHRLPLGSYLALPIQRILRYHLLLKVGVEFIYEYVHLDNELMIRFYV